MKKQILSVALALGLTLPGLAAAQSMAPRDTTPRAAALDTGSFLARATEGNLAELRLSILAAERASSPALRRFAQTIIEEHSRVGNELGRISADKGLVVLSVAPSASNEASYQRLNSLSGADFDREYLAAMSASHEESIRLFEQASAQLRDDDFRRFAASTLPTLRTHLRELRGMMGQRMTPEANTPTPESEYPPVDVLRSPFIY